MKNCFLYQNDLKAYTDGELSLPRRWAVHRHLTHCASCRKEIKAMTQVTEDLRSSEPGDTLSPSLREKLLEPGTGPAGLLSNESASGTEDSGVAERLSLNRRSALPVPGLRKRPLPAWTFAALAVVAWFVCYPMFQNVRENSRRVTLASPQAEHQIKVFKPLPQRTADAVIKSDGPAPPEGPKLPPVPEHLAPPPTMSVRPVPPMEARVPAPAPPARATGRLTEAAPPLDIEAAPPLAIGGGTNLNRNANDLNGDPDSLRQVHKEAGIGLQVPNPDATGDKINDMVKETGGYVAANNLTTDTNGLKSGELIVKVPEVQFETFLAAVAKLGTVVSKNITGQDITEKTSDAHEAQAVEESDLEQAEARLKALGSHAKWEDKEDTQDQRVRLAQTRARLKMLKRMAALGTITIDLSETPKAVGAAVPAASGFTGLMKTTTHDALESLSGSAAALLALVIWLLAYSPIWVPLLLLGRYALKEYKKREAAQLD